MVQGTVAKCFENSFGDKVFHAFALQGKDGVYFRTGEKKLVEEGDVIEFEDKNVNGNIYANNVKKTGKVDGAKASTGKKNFAGAAKSSARDEYWEQKEARDIINGKAMRWQGAYDRAIKLVDLMLSNEAVKPPSALKQLAKRAEYVETLVEEYAHRIYDKTGEVSEGTSEEPATEPTMEVGTQDEGDDWNE